MAILRWGLAMMKILSKGMLLLFIVCLIGFLYLRVADSDPQAMLAKYGDDIQTVSDGVGGQIYYRDQGVRDGPVLLLIHGSNASMQTWNGMVAQLANRYRLLSFDQHGHGFTGAHGKRQYGADARIDAALRVLDAAGVKQAFWVGNSMGGWLSWRAALAVPERVQGLVLIDASGAQGGEKIRLYLAARLASSKLGQWLMPYITPRSLIEQSLHKNFADSAKVTPEIVDQYWEMIRFPGNRQATADFSRVSRDPEMWQQIQQIQLPTLILWGQQDSVIPVSHAALFQQKIEESEVKIYPHAGHLPMEEIPQEVAMDIDQWLESRLVE